jgi:hypothetical protein
MVSRNVAEIIQKQVTLEVESLTGCILMYMCRVFRPKAVLVRQAKLVVSCKVKVLAWNSKE